MNFIVTTQTRPAIVVKQECVLSFALRKSMSAHSGETERGGEIAHTLLLNIIGADDEGVHYNIRM
jgi:hypothetical protein